MIRALIFVIGLLLLGALVWFCTGHHQPKIEQELQTRTTAALQSAGLDSAGIQVGLNGRDVTLQGVVADAAARGAAEQAAAQVDGVRTVDNQLQLLATVVEPEPALEYVTRLHLEAGQLTLEGLVPDADGRAALLQAAADLSPDFTVIDRLEQTAGAPAHWLSSLRAGLTALAGLDSGYANLRDDTLAVGGQLLAQADPQALESGIARSLDGAVQSSFDWLAPALPSPEAVREQQQAAAISCQESFNSLLTGETVQFENNAATIKTVSFALLDELAGVAATCPAARIEIAGHSDSAGAAEYNKGLSERRAAAVQDYLRSQGIDADRLRARGYGEERPIASNSTAAGRAKNRRVELVVEGV